MDQEKCVPRHFCNLFLVNFCYLTWTSTFSSIALPIKGTARQGRGGGAKTPPPLSQCPSGETPVNAGLISTQLHWKIIRKLGICLCIAIHAQSKQRAMDITINIWPSDSKHSQTCGVHIAKPIENRRDTWSRNEDTKIQRTSRPAIHVREAHAIPTSSKPAPPAINGMARHPKITFVIDTL